MVEPFNLKTTVRSRRMATYIGTEMLWGLPILKIDKPLCLLGDSLQINGRDWPIFDLLSLGGY